MENGQNIRDWLYVEDHCQAIYLVLKQGKIGSTYNIGGLSEQTNLAVVEKICAILDNLAPIPNQRYSTLMTFVPDRPGHDRRYAIDCSKISRELGWKPKQNFDEGLLLTVKWYLDNSAWIDSVRSGAYQNWIKQNYDNRKV